MGTINKRPHTATLYYHADGTFDATTKDYTEGAETSVALTGYISIPNYQKYVNGPSGDVNQIRFVFFSDRFSGDTDIPHKGLKLNFNDEDHLVLRFTLFTKHLEFVV